jgi:pyridinium-3,5-bisthiocarboxylic acid mononucleotide nickel chelatase
MLSHTTTFGVRRVLCSRYILDREITTAETAYGPIRVKTGTGYGVTKSKPEYEDAARAARENGVPLADIIKVVEQH